jgi:hypothetical protein
MSNHNYESVKETMQEIGIDESYIEKTLKLYGLEEFPKSGLNDKGLSKLVKTATDIAHSEASLTTIKPKKVYLPVQKIKKAKNSGNLESQIIKEDLKKVEEIGKRILKCAVYPILNLFILPTLTRKASSFIEKEREGKEWLLLVFGEAIIGTSTLYMKSFKNNQKLLPYILGAQVITNIISGIYEYIRHVKKESEDECHNTKNHCNICSNSKCSHYPT